MEKKSFKPNPNDHFDTEARAKALTESEKKHQEKTEIARDLVFEIVDKMDVENIIDIEELLMTRIVRGMVFMQIPGFKTPIVKLELDLDLVNEDAGDKAKNEDIEKIVSYLKREGKLLPIDSHFHPL